MTWKKLLPILLIFFVWATLKMYGYDDFLTLEFIVQQQGRLQDFYHRTPMMALTLFSTLYIATTALALPGAAILTLLAGSIFGLSAGVPLVSFSSTVGASLSFLISRFLLRNWVEKKFSHQLAAINRGVRQEGGFYLFTLRLIPAFPFFLVNILMGLTRMKVLPFFFISLIGMLPGTIVYVNAGEQLSQIHSLQDILSPVLLFSFALLGILPWTTKKIFDYIRKRRCYRPFKKPRQIDYNMVVIGGGAAGLVTALSVQFPEGQDRFGRKKQNGWRLPQYRLRSIQGPAQIRIPDCPSQAVPKIWY